MSVVVRLDDLKFAGGPATVVAIVDTIEEYRAIAERRDGVLDPALRLWDGGGAVGDRVQLADPSPERVREMFEEWKWRRR